MGSVLFAATVTAAVVPDYFVGWGTLSLINAGLAQSKNRSGLGWWLASLLLGPIATFLIVISEKIEQPVRFEAASNKPAGFLDL